MNRVSMCSKRDSNGVRCELPKGHEGQHACPQALSEWLASRRGSRVDGLGEYEIWPADGIALPEHALSLLREERDRNAAALHLQAAEIERMSPIEYLGRGLHAHSVRGYELAGRMSKAGFSTIEYIWGKPGWRVMAGNSEYYVSKEQIAKVFE